MTRLQHKNFTFGLPSGDKPLSRILTSKLIVNKNKTDILISQLFFGIKKENDGSIKGYSILEFLECETSTILINDKPYIIEFENENEIFVLKSVTEPKNFVLKDKNFDTSELEKKIEESTPAQVTEQPPLSKTEEEIQPAGVTVFEECEEYKSEIQEQINSGYELYNTSEKSNYRLLVCDQKNPQLILIELFENDYEVIDENDFEIELNEQEKTFTINKDE